MNNVTKTLSSKDMQLTWAQKKNWIDSFLHNYRDTGFTSAKAAATGIATTIDEPKFRERFMKKEIERLYRITPEKWLETDYLLVTVGRAFMSLTTWFEEMQGYAKNWRFLYYVKKLRGMNEDDLKT
jgi:hypothetical protein